jgi:hypothetical protein
MAWWGRDVDCDLNICRALYLCLQRARVMDYPVGVTQNKLSSPLLLV